MTTPILYMIPGTGTDFRMYTPQLKLFPELIVLSWLPPLDRYEPISSYAKRLTTQIDASKPFFLGGTSLGGMIAQEMTKEVKPLGLILIATCSTSKSLPLLWRISGRLMRLSPNFLVKLWIKLMANGVRQANNTTLPDKDIYAQMIADMPPTLLRWQSGAAVEWKLTESLTMPVFHIHGAKDKVIPLKRISYPKQVIQDGGHLINITHATAVNDFIGLCLADV